MNELIKGPAMVLGPEEGESYWQPVPHRGYMTVKVSPRNHPSNLFSMGIQVIPPGCHIRAHGHARNDEILFIYQGSGHCVVDGKTHKLEPGSTTSGPDTTAHSWRTFGKRWRIGSAPNCGVAPRRSMPPSTWMACRPRCRLPSNMS